MILADINWLILRTKWRLQISEKVHLALAVSLHANHLVKVHVLVRDVNALVTMELGEHVVPPVVFTGPHLLFHNSGLLELVIYRFRRVTVDSQNVRGSADWVRLSYSFEELLPLGVADDCVDLIKALSSLQGFCRGVVGAAEHFHNVWTQSDKFSLNRFKTY